MHVRYRALTPDKERGQNERVRHTGREENKESKCAELGFNLVFS